MDSVTQAALGAAVAGAVAGKRCNGKVLLAGALLGTLPDLDVFIDYGDDISNMVHHRGFTHSLFVLFPFSLLLAVLVHKFRPLPNWSFGRLWLLISLALITHPLLDYFTSYGTQLLWPIPGYFSLSSIFIIDPLYTVPLLIAILYGLIHRERAAKCCALALTVSSMYLGWSLVAKHIVEQRAIASLQALDLPVDNIFMTPMPFNTVLWRIVVLDGESYWEGVSSLLDKNKGIEFYQHHRGKWPLPEKPKALDQMLVFSHGFVSYRVEGDHLIVSDLRMGLPGNFFFQFQFARKDMSNHWQVQAPKRIRREMAFNNVGELVDQLLGKQGGQSHVLSKSPVTQPFASGVLRYQSSP